MDRQQSMMLIGYARISRSGGAQSTDLQIDALEAAGVDRQRIYRDVVSGAQANRPGLDECLRSLRQGDTLVVWRLDRLGRPFAWFNPILRQIPRTPKNRRDP